MFSRQTQPVLEENPLLRKRLVFDQGSNYFRQRLVLSLLSSRPVKITDIRSSSSDLTVGLLPHEISFLHLIVAVSNGTRLKISETGTEVSLSPGVLAGGTLSYTCDGSRPLSYYLEPLLLLAPFCKKGLDLTLKGRVQNDQAGFNSIYKLKHAALPIMETFGLEPELQVNSRSYAESEIRFTCNVKKQLLTLRSQYNQDCGKVKKIRGLSYGFRVSPQMLNRVVTAAKGVFLPFLSDVYITTDQVKGSKSKLPGYGLVLYAVTTKEVTYCADGFIGKDEESDTTKALTTVMKRNLDNNESLKRKFDLFPDEEEDEESGPGKKKKSKKSKANDAKLTVPEVKAKAGTVTSPEELGIHVARLLLKEMSNKACVDSVFQWLVLGYMALGPKDVTSVILGSLTPYTIQYLRDLKTFFGVTFKIEDHSLGDDDEEDDDEDESKYKPQLHKLSCLGTGYINLNKTQI